MKAILLAAGRGERMRPLTDSIPKPLLRAGGKTLIEWQIGRLVRAGIDEIVVNHAWLGAMIERALGDGSAYGATLRYSPEPPGALETGGGIRNALALLGDAPFLAVNADVWTDYPYERLALRADADAHLVLVDNPDHHPQGDFALEGDRVRGEGTPRYTFSGIGVYRAGMFLQRPPGCFPLAPLLRELADAGRLSGEHYAGRWTDVGTPERLALLDAALQRNT